MEIDSTFYRMPRAQVIHDATPAGFHFSLKSPQRITHYQRLLDHIVPDVVHVLSRGRIVRTGGKELALELEASGYAEYRTSEAA